MKEVIEKVLSNFDFEKVHIVMTGLNWEWAQPTRKVPSISALVLRAKDLLEDVSTMEPGCSVSTGGLRATKIQDESTEGLMLEFVLEQSEYC